MALEPTWNDARKSFLQTQVAGSTDYWTLNDLEWAYANNPAPPVVPPGPLDTVEEVWIFGASLEVGICSRSDPNDMIPIIAQKISHAVGRGITVVNKSLSGDTLPGMEERFIDDWYSTAEALGNKLLVVTMPLGGNITSARPYPGDMPNLKNEFDSFMETIKSTGAHVLPVNTTFRDYDDSVHNEENGSLPYNDAIVLPYVQENPDAAYGGAPYANPYNITRNWYDTILSDGVHLTPEGYYLLRNFWTDFIIARILGEAPPMVPRIENPEVAMEPYEIRLNYVVGNGILRNLSVYGFFNRGNNTQGTTRIENPVGYAPSSTTVLYYAPLSTFDNGAGTASTGNNTPTLANDELRRYGLYTASTSFVNVDKYSGLLPNQPVEVDILSMRITDTPRKGRFSLDGGATYTEIDENYTAGQEPVIHTLQGVANSSGEITLSMAAPAADGFAYLNAAVVRPLPIVE